MSSSEFSPRVSQVNRFEGHILTDSVTQVPVLFPNNCIQLPVQSISSVSGSTSSSGSISGSGSISDSGSGTLSLR